MSRRRPAGRSRPLLRLDRRADGLGVQLGRGVSGRVVVLGAVLGVLVLWGTLSLLFRGWRAEVEARIAIGKDRVPPVVEPLIDVEPPGIPAEDWRRAVVATREMLDEVVGTGRLDREGIERLRSELATKVVEAAHDPGSAPEILAGIWDQMARVKRLRAGTERPAVLGRSATRPDPDDEGRGTDR